MKFLTSHIASFLLIPYITNRILPESSIPPAFRSSPPFRLLLSFTFFCPISSLIFSQRVSTILSRSSPQTIAPEAPFLVLLVRVYFSPSQILWSLHIPNKSQRRTSFLSHTLLIEYCPDLLFHQDSVLPRPFFYLFLPRFFSQPLPWYSSNVFPRSSHYLLLKQLLEMLNSWYPLVHSYTCVFLTQSDSVISTCIQQISM